MGRARMIVTRSFVVNDKWEMLLVRRAPTSKHNPGLWECPGGRVPPGQYVLGSRAREVFEETGFFVKSISLAAHFIEEQVIADGEYKGTNCLRIFDVAMIIGGKFKLSPEHDEFKWVSSYDELLTYNITPEVRKAATAFSKFLG